MLTVKQFFGVLLLAVAVWILSPVIPVAAQMFLWAALLTGAGVFLRVLEPLGKEASGWERLGKGAGILALLLGAAQGIRALSGARDPLRPLAGPLAQSREKPLQFQTVKTLAHPDARLK